MLFFFKAILWKYIEICRLQFLICCHKIAWFWPEISQLTLIFHNVNIGFLNLEAKPKILVYVDKRWTPVGVSWKRKDFSYPAAALIRWRRMQEPSEGVIICPSRGRQVVRQVLHLGGVWWRVQTWYCQWYYSKPFSLVLLCMFCFVPIWQDSFQNIHTGNVNKNELERHIFQSLPITPVQICNWSLPSSGGTAWGIASYSLQLGTKVNNKWLKLFDKYM